MILISRKTLIYLVITISLANCSISRIVYNAHKPRVEEKSSINNWLKKNKLPNENICSVKPENLYTYLMLFEVRKGFPMIFHRNGTFLSLGYSNGSVCYKSFPEILSGLRPPDSISFSISDYIIYQRGQKPDIILDTVHFHMNTILKGLADLEGNDISEQQIDNLYDYTVLIPFALYFGNTIQTKDLRRNIKAVQKNTKSKIKLVLIDFDKQKWWGEYWIKKINIDI